MDKTTLFNDYTNKFNLLNQSFSRNTFLPFLIGLCTGLYFITLNIIGIDFSFLPADLGDGRFNLYILEHAYQYFVGNIHEYWSAPFMFPEKNVITFSDNLLGTAPFYILFRLIQLDRETSFQCWFILITVLNYTSCYLFLNWFFKNKYAAVAGAMIFAFSMALQIQLALPQNYARFPIPLSLWAMLLFFEELKPRYLFFSLLMVVYQLYCGMYIGLMLMIVISIAFLTGLIVYRKTLFKKPILKKFSIGIFLSIAISILALLPLIVPYIKRSYHMGKTVYEEIFSTIPVMYSFLCRKKGTLLWDNLPDITINVPAPWSHMLFPGGIAICSIILFSIAAVYVFIKSIKEKNSKSNNSLFVLFCTMVLTFLLFVRTKDFSLYQYIFILPGISVMRSICRIINVELLFFGFACSFLFNSFIKAERKNAMFLFLVFITLFIADNYYPVDELYHIKKNECRLRIDNLVKKMARIKQGSIISYEPNNITENVIYYQIDAMLASQEAGMKCLNAYTGASPISYTPYWDNPIEESRVFWLAYKDFRSEDIAVIK